jgi:hypothetical protein
LTYNGTEKLLHFIHRYIEGDVGITIFGKWVKLNGSKTLLDRITPSDITYTVIVYENSVDVWREELQIKGRSTTKEERRRANRHQKPKYHHAIGKHIQHYSDGWTLIGKEEMIEQLTALKASNMWSILQGHWTTY